MNLIIDTREQNPLPFKEGKSFEEIINKKLNAGDYSIEGFENKIAIERKSPADLFGTLGKGHSRFRKEIDRAKEYDYFGILVEASFRAVRDKKFDNSFRCSLRGDVLLKIAFTLKVKYGVDIVFVNDRAEAVSFITHLFKAYHKMKLAEMTKYRGLKKDGTLPPSLYYDEMIAE